MSVIDEILQTQEFATLPEVASKLLNLLSKEDFDISTISRTIESDPSLTAKLLAVANSSIFASRSNVKSIKQAVMTLGINRLNSIVLGVSIFTKFLLKSDPTRVELMKKFWWHAACVAIVSKTLSQKLNRKDYDKEFLGGLMHDVGKLLFMQYDYKKYQITIDTVLATNLTDSEAEKRVFGVTHSEAGKAIAEKWRLPMEIQDAIEFHEHPEQSENHKLSTAIIRISDLLCELWDAGFYEGIHQIFIDETPSWKILTEEYPYLKDIDVEQFTFELENEYKKSDEFLNIIGAS